MEKNKGGRPTKYSLELSDRICEMLARGKSMRTVAKEDWSPSIATMFMWLRTNDKFSEQYEKAKEESADALVEEMLDIADDGSNDYMESIGKDGKTYTKINAEHVQRSRLRVDARKWISSKLKPKRYGDKLDVTSDGKALPTPIYGGKSE